MKLIEQLIGVWQLISMEDRDANGQVMYPLGEEPTGYLMYHPDGYVSAQLMRKGRPPYASGDLLQGTVEEMAEAARGYLAYVGKFEVKEEENRIIHYIDVSLNPTLIGTELHRIPSFDGEIMTLHNGKKPQQKFVFRRVEDLDHLKQLAIYRRIN